MKSGLDDVVAAETVLSDVDGKAGRLIIRGASLDDLVRHNHFEDVLALLLAGFIESLPEPAWIGAALGAARAEIYPHLDAADPVLLQAHPIEAMRALIARIGDGEDVTTALRLVAAPAVLLPGLLRLRQGLDPLAPDASLGHAADILRMTQGWLPSFEQTAALDTYLMTVSDHGLNASTFAARVVASTHAGLASAVLAALSALKGPLHGGAPGPVLDMLDGIGRPERAELWLEAALARAERLMGFGHRIYRVRDPRADALKAVIQNLVQTGQVDNGRFALAEAVESAALSLLKRQRPDRALETNVEFYTALLLEALGFPRDAFTCVFAIGRVSGWIAHAREQMLGGRLMRPQSLYVGPQPQRAA